MKISQRLLSGITSLALLLTQCLSVPIISSAETTKDLMSTEQDVSLKANNTLGSLLLAESGEVKNIHFSNGYGVSDVHIDSGVATINWYAETTCQLLLAFYSEDEAIMYAMCDETVTPVAIP